VIDLVGMQRPDDTNIVGDAANVRKEVADLLAGLTVTVESGKWTETDQSLALQLRNWLPLRKTVGHRLAVEFGELGFVIEALQVRGPTRHTQKNHAFDFWWDVQRIDHST